MSLEFVAIGDGRRSRKERASSILDLNRLPSLRNRFDTVMERRTASISVAPLSLQDRLRAVALHGDFSLAYSAAVQTNLACFGDASGYIAFGRKMNGAFALGDPVAAHAERPRLIRMFVAAAGDPCFVQVGAESATTLAGLGYTVNRMGIDTRLSLSAGTFAGKRNETVRYSERWLLKQGFALVDETHSESARDHVEAMSERWRATRIVRRREMQFLNRPFRAALGPGMRRFMLLDPAGEPAALLDLDPLHRDGEVVGYTTSFKRKLPGVTPHAEIGLTKFAADRIRDEGMRFMTLGLSPLAAIEPAGFRESALLRRAFGMLHSSSWINRRIFNLQGQAAFKRRFHGAEEPVYIAFRRLSVIQMLGLLRLCKTF